MAFDIYDFPWRSRAQNQFKIKYAVTTCIDTPSFLAVGALFAGKLGYEFFGRNYERLLGNALLVLKENTTIERPLAFHCGWCYPRLCLFWHIAGLLLLSIETRSTKMLSSKFSGIYQFLLNKWYFDELYDLLFVRSAFRFGHASWKKGDGAVIDGLGPDGISSMVRRLSGQAVRLQSGFFTLCVHNDDWINCFASWYIFGFGINLMTDDWPILSLVTFLPLVGCFFILLTRGDDATVGELSLHCPMDISSNVPYFALIWVKFDLLRLTFR